MSFSIRKKLPNPHRVIVDIAKLRDYCLNPRHPRGRHKARVFAAVLGMHEQHAEMLRLALLTAAAGKEAVLGECDAYGQRYMLDFEMAGPAGNGTVRSNWIVLAHEDFPRLTSCYVL